MFLHWEEKNLGDELLMEDPKISSNLEFVNNQSDYNMHTNLPFMYQLKLLKYHELVKHYDVENNYDPNIPKWANVNYPRTSMYDNAHLDVLEEALPFQTNHKSKGIKRERRNPERRSHDFMHLAKLVQILSKICAFYRIRKHLITECPQIDREMKDGFVRHVGQQMLDKSFIEQP